MGAAGVYVARKIGAPAASQRAANEFLARRLRAAAGGEPLAPALDGAAMLGAAHHRFHYTLFERSGVRRGEATIEVRDERVSEAQAVLDGRSLDLFAPHYDDEATTDASYNNNNNNKNVDEDEDVDDSRVNRPADEPVTTRHRMSGTIDADFVDVTHNPKKRK